MKNRIVLQYIINNYPNLPTHLHTPCTNPWGDKFTLSCSMVAFDSNAIWLGNLGCTLPVLIVILFPTKTNVQIKERDEQKILGKNGLSRRSFAAHHRDWCPLGQEKGDPGLLWSRQLTLVTALIYFITSFTREMYPLIRLPELLSTGPSSFVVEHYVFLPSPCQGNVIIAPTLLFPWGRQAGGILSLSLISLYRPERWNGDKVMGAVNKSVMEYKTEQLSKGRFTQHSGTSVLTATFPPCSVCFGFL